MRNEVFGRLLYLFVNTGFAHVSSSLLSSLQRLIEAVLVATFSIPVGYNCYFTISRWNTLQLRHIRVCLLSNNIGILMSPSFA